MSDDVRLLFAREAERVYRLQHGTIKRLIQMKRLRATRRGARFLVSVKQCEALFAS